MPEGHTLHRLAREQASLVGRQVRASSPQGRFAEGASWLDGRTVDDVDAYGKHLLHRFGDHHLHVHLGLRGFFLRHPSPLPEPRGQVRLRLAAPDEGWDLIAPLRCEILDDGARGDLLGRLGPDPLRDDADPDDAWRRLSRQRGAVGVALLDQAVIAGIGNVVRTEALAACGIAPQRPSGEISRVEFDCLWTCASSILERATALGRIVTVDGPGSDDLPESEARYVYKQERCRRCGTPIETADLAGRTAYWCPRDQPS